MDCMRLFTKEDVLDGDEKPVSQLLSDREAIPSALLRRGHPGLAPFILSFRHAAAAEPENDV